MSQYLSIRDLQKISGEAIASLPGPTAIKSGDRTIALLIPLKRADPRRLRSTLARAEALAGDRDAQADDASLSGFGEVDPTDWSYDAVQDFLKLER